MKDDTEAGIVLAGLECNEGFDFRAAIARDLEQVCKSGALFVGLRQSAQLAWRALAMLQLELEEAGEAPRARGARKV